MTILHAQPYNIDARGFNFSTAEDFTTQASALRDRFGAPVEEFEIQHIDGDNGQLFEACRIHQGDLDTWFDDIETLDDHQKAALYYLTDCNGYGLNEALEKLEDVCISECSLIEAASELFDECYLSEVPEAVRNYIDYEAFANDCRLGGDMCEFRFNGATFTCTNASVV
jgi:antirestriction protein